MAINNDIQLDDDLFTQSINDLASRFETGAAKSIELPSEWIEKNFFVPSPRDLITGEVLPPGYIKLADHQKRIINEALSKDEKGNYKYATIIYSAPKKSGKSATAAAVALYIAAHTPFGQIALLANAGKQSEDRLLLPIQRCIEYHKQRKLPLRDSKINLVEVFLSNAAHIEAVPVNASGEAGSEPSGVFLSEIWGYDTDAKKKLFAEYTIPVTLWGRSLRWIETYAGYIGQSDLLWDLYQRSKQGEPHPDFTDLEGRDGETVVWVNRKAKMFTYWDTAHRLAWQQDNEYYEQEAQTLTPMEFERLHFNQWVSPVGVFIRGEWWDACASPDLPDLIPGSNVPCVLGVDAAVSGDCAALVLVTRDPYQPEIAAAVRYVKIIKPLPNKPINIEDDIGREIRRLSKLYNIVCVAYDAYQMESLVQNYRRGSVALSAEEKLELSGKSKVEIEQYRKQEERAAQLWYYKFGQHGSRAIADKRLYDMVINRQLRYNPNDLNSDLNMRGSDETLEKHIKQAGSKETGSGSQLRIEKLSSDAKIDGAVALSMALDRCMIMNLDNRELHLSDILSDYQRGKITYQQYLDRIRDHKNEAAVRT